MNLKHIQNKKKLRIIGACLMILGLSLIVGGITGFVVANISPLVFLSFPGVLCIGGGFICIILTIQSSIMRYVANESIPVLNEASQQMQPAIRNFSSAAKDGIDRDVVCTCGMVNDQDAKFCKNCGKALKATCPYCGKQLDGDCKFCQECGKQL